ncbi:FtsB family cell division protein [Labedella endophytica]|uniref:Septum formation initiator family protein n=1 Tax=Labedella endophytica TaxID=1523160 RepID=A0A433JQC4_9MICO|nr:septum formation initiator family protein [Labedella endophytica]RUQ99180.1 septum formation initiator family protein [Labedella endophytica]
MSQPRRRPRDQRVRAAASSSAAASGSAWLRGLRFSGFSLLMMGLLILGVVVLAPNISAFVDQRQEIAELSAQVTEDGETVDRLTAERERWNDSTFVMTQARERFFYVNPGEVSFLVINDLDAAVLADVDEPVSSELTVTDTDWTQSLLASLLSSAYAEEVTGSSE